MELNLLDFLYVTYFSKVTEIMAFQVAGIPNKILKSCLVHLQHF